MHGIIQDVTLDICWLNLVILCAQIKLDCNAPSFVNWEQTVVSLQTQFSPILLQIFIRDERMTTKSSEIMFWFFLVFYSLP